MRTEGGREGDETRGGEGRGGKWDKNTGRISEGWRNSTNISFWQIRKCLAQRLSVLTVDAIRCASARRREEAVLQQQTTESGGFETHYGTDFFRIRAVFHFFIEAIIHHLSHCEQKPPLSACCPLYLLSKADKCAAHGVLWHLKCLI